MEFAVLIFAIYSSWFTGTLADYTCVCNDEVYSVEVYQEAKNTSSIIGHIDHTQCKQEVCDQGHQSWIKIEYETQFGYVASTSWITRRMCTGNQPMKTAETCDIITEPVTTQRPSPIVTDTVKTSVIKTATSAVYTHKVTDSVGTNVTLSYLTQHTTKVTDSVGTNVTTKSSPTQHTTKATSYMTDGNAHNCPSSLRNGAAYYHVLLGQHGTKCYTMDTHHKLSWQHAEETCALHGGHLIHIQNEDEQLFVASFVARHSPHENVWIGLHDRVAEGVYIWSNYGLLTYSHWAPHHLNMATHHVDDCVVMRPDGFWDDVTCGHRGFFGDRGHTLPYICQFEYHLPGLLGIVG